MSIELARHGAHVSAFDISDESARTARHALEEAGFGHRASVYVMDAENLAFADNTFDIIVCSGVLHHLDLERAYYELARVLKPGGKDHLHGGAGAQPGHCTLSPAHPSLADGVGGQAHPEDPRCEARAPLLRAERDALLSPLLHRWRLIQADAVVPATPHDS